MKNQNSKTTKAAHAARPGLEQDIQAVGMDFTQMLAEHEETIASAEEVDRGSSTETPLEDRVNVFWSWFLKNEAIFFFTELDDNNVVKEKDLDLIVELNEACMTVDKNFSIEIDPSPRADGKRQLILSANGIGDSFKTIEMLYELAPPMARWEVVRYRQRSKRYGYLQMKDYRLVPEDVRFGIGKHTNTGQLSIYVFIQNYEETKNNAWENMTFMLLDSLLGEFDVVTKVHSVVFSLPSEHLKVKRITHTELAPEFDRLFQLSLN